MYHRMGECVSLALFARRVPAPNEWLDRKQNTTEENQFISLIDILGAKTKSRERFGAGGARVSLCFVYAGS